MKIAVIIPTLNEAQNIPLLIPAIHSILKNNYEIVVIDDNSSDGTPEYVLELSDKYSVRLLSRPYKRGLASAVIYGINSVNTDAIIVMDADLSHPPALLSKLREGLDRYDLVVASRYVKGGGSYGWPLYRRMISRVASYIPRILLTPIKDNNSGYFAIKTSCLQGVPLAPVGFKIGLEIFVKCPSYTWTEIPYVFEGRLHGKSKCKPGEYINYLRHLGALHRYKINHIWERMKLAQVSTR